MSGKKHTPEPWHVDTTDGDVKAFYIKAEQARIAKICVAPTEEIDAANAHRIVACVNACAGIDTKDLEEVQSHFGAVYIEAKESAKKSREQRDELLGLANELRQSILDDEDALFGRIDLMDRLTQTIAEIEATL